MNIFHLTHKCRLRFQQRSIDDSSGFASAQFVGLMGLTIVTMALLVNIFIIEYTRSATLTSLRNAARAGTRVVDLSRVVGTPDEEKATDECKARLLESVQQLFSADESNSEINCEIIEDDSSGSIRYSMKATMTPKTIKVVPGAQVFAKRLEGLSATYEQKQVANNNGEDDIPVVIDDDSGDPDAP